MIIWTKFTQKEYFWSKTKNVNINWIMHIRISLRTTFHLKLKVLIYWTKFAQKQYSRSKIDKVNITNEFCIFELVYGPNSSLNWQFWFFGPDLPKKGYSGSKTEKVNITIEFCIFELLLLPSFSLNWQVWLFGQICPKRVLQV